MNVRVLQRRLWLAVVLAAACAAVSAGCGSEARPKSDKPSDFQTFESRPDLRPPVIDVVTPAKATAPGYLFIGPKNTGGAAGPLIADNRGQVVWFHPMRPREPADFRVQRYRGQSVLTWWEGTQPAVGIGTGRFVIMDSSYREIAVVRAGNGLQGDLHEFLITPQNTALIMAYERVPHDLSSVGGPKKGQIWDNVVQEIDVETGRVLFEWRSADHVEITESMLPRPTTEKAAKKPFDYFHLNSIDVDTDGNLLISARHTHAVYKISRRDGKVLWTLGGKKSDFTMGPGTRFAFQHDVRRQPDGTISVFDNSAAPKVAEQSRAIVLRLDAERKAATLVRAYAHPRKVLSAHQGNAQRLEDGGFMVGWGGTPRFTEFSADGRVVFDARLPVGDSYRAYRLPWTGRPLDRPAVAARTGTDDHVTVYASWNGATEVARWEVLAGPAAGRLRVIDSSPNRGFETAIPVRTDAQYVAVRALDAAGNVLRTSRAVEPRQA